VLISQSVCPLVVVLVLCSPLAIVCFHKQCEAAVISQFVFCVYV